jgi:peptide/nickel transport system substrate-binding protein
MYLAASLIGDAIIARSPIDGKFGPWLADSWTFSEDGLTWTFILKKGIKWHDGTTLTAKDFAFTFNRAVNPETKSVSTGPMLAALDKAEAVDDQTLVLHLKEPNAPLLVNLAIPAYLSPLPQAAVEKDPQGFGRKPIGEGPFKFVEWQTSVKITLARNGEWTWRPFWASAGPYLDTIEIRFIPEYSTLLAGLESGDLDTVGIDNKDVKKVEGEGLVNIYAAVGGGNPGYVSFNCSKPPFDDVKVRQALAYAVDRAPIIQVVYNGDAVPMYGGITPTTAGYDPIQEKDGFPLDVNKAKALLAEAGWTAGSDGIMVKNGTKLSFTLNTLAGQDAAVKLAQIVQQQWKAIGVDAKINQLDVGTAIGDLNSGNFESTIMGFGYPDWDVVVLLFASKEAGGAGDFFVTDPKWDELLKATRTNVDPAARQAAINAADKYMMQNAFLISFAATKTYIGMNKRIGGFILSEITSDAWYFNCYVK